MPLFVWKENLSVSVKSMDEQHKKLIDMLNEFYDNIAHRPNTENIAILLNSLRQYIIVHFSLEERYMEQSKFPDYKEHKKQHDAFITKVEELEEKLNNGKMLLSLEVTTFLKDWLLKHIQISDKKYSEHFAKNGIK
jgi:hemerythrin